MSERKEPRTKKSYHLAPLTMTQVGDIVYGGLGGVFGGAVGITLCRFFYGAYFFPVVKFLLILGLCGVIWAFLTALADNCYATEEEDE